MIRPPTVSPDMASALLALLDIAESRAPGDSVAWLRGYCAARAVERVELPASLGPAHSAALARRVG